MSAAFVVIRKIQLESRRILNQHVLMEIAAFAGLIGGAIGLDNPIFKSYEFFRHQRPRADRAVPEALAVADARG